MYIGSTGPSGLHHLVWELVDNSVDEAMAGVCTRIDVTILADGSCRVSDDGRGIPVEEHPQYPGKSAAEIAMTTCTPGESSAAGGTRCRADCTAWASVVNALSTKLTLEIDRNGEHYQMSFKDGGKPQGKLKVTGPAPRGRTGTTITFTPDPTIFDDVDFRAQTITERLQIMAFLNRGLEIRFADERAGRRVEGDLQVQRRHRRLRAPPQQHQGVAVSQGRLPTNRPNPDQEVEVAFQWNTGYYESIHSFANGIATIEGGMHEEGFRKAITNVVNRYARKRNLLKEKDENLKPVRTSAKASPRSCSVRWPSRSSRVRPRASSATSSIRSLVERATNEKLADWLEENPKEGGQIVAKAVQASRARHGGAPRARPHATQERARRRRTAGQARRLLVERTSRVRTVHCRGKLRRRIGEGRA
jgi:DNA gyrase subunit B